MSTPRKVDETDIHAYLDGELPPERAADVTAHVNANPEIAERLGAYRRNDEQLRTRFDSVLEEPIPERLRVRRRGMPALARYAAAVCWLMIGLAAGWFLHDVRRIDRSADAPAWARRAAVAHAVYSPEVRHPVEVGADQEAHLVAWLSKRLGAQLRIPKLSAIGYSLVGGRLLPGERGPAAQFMYQDSRGQRLTLYVRTNRDAGQETAFRFAEDGTVRVFYWIDRGLGLALSGEIEKQELLRVANTVYQQLNP
jgi:anti-sigma factor RsiW